MSESSVYFETLCKVFNKIRETTQPSKKRDIVNDFIHNYKTCIVVLSKSDSVLDGTCFPILRLILPGLDRDRGAYGIKAVKFAKIITKILSLPPQSNESLQLINFRASDNSCKIADFADAAYWTLRRRFWKRKGISISEVNSSLDKIVQKNTDNDARGLEQEILTLFNSCGHAEDLKWIIRIILKDLRLGIGPDSILNIFHPDASELYDHCNDLKRVCEVLTDQSKRLNEMEISVFTPFRPMLSKRCNQLEFNKKISDNCNYLIETKFDGERFQLHMRNGNFKYFSRNGYDYSQQYGHTYTQGIYTPLLIGAFHDSIQTIILDGEMMGYNKKKKKFGSKGMHFDVKTLKQDSEHQSCFCVFDILLLNGKILTNTPLRSRIKLLEELIRPKEGVLMLSSVKEGYCKQDILNALNMSADNEEEGIVFKEPSSIYRPNDRNSGWWKMKMEYFEGAITDLDVIILGGYYGEGRLRNQISGFLVGILISEADGSCRKFKSLAKIASGLSNKELLQVDQKLGRHWRSNGHQDAKNYGILWGKEVPDVWVKPEDSCILTVRASELTKTQKMEFSTNYTLRFPRILKMRSDKLYYDCLSTSEFEELTCGNKAVEKLTKCHIFMEDIENMQSNVRVKKRKYQAPTIPVAEQKSNFLNGFEFCVLTGNKAWTIEDIQKAVQENGGEIVLTEGPNTLCLLLGDDHPRVEFLKSTNANIDIVKVEWLKRILESGTFDIYKPHEAVYLSKISLLRHKQFYDKYKDSYTELVSEQSLQETITNVEITGDYINTVLGEIQSVPLLSPYHLFKQYVAYFDKYKIVNDTLSTEIYDSFLDEMTFRFYGGLVSNFLSQDVNLVIIKNDSRNDNRAEEISSYLHLIKNSAQIVTREFMRNAISNYNLTPATCQPG